MRRFGGQSSQNLTGLHAVSFLSRNSSQKVAIQINTDENVFARHKRADHHDGPDHLLTRRADHCHNRYRAHLGRDKLRRVGSIGGPGKQRDEPDRYRDRTPRPEL
jgi:hypothetical protein